MKGAWTEQQKPTASDGQPNDHFSEHAVALESDILVVGANRRDLAVSGDNAGGVYIFRRRDTVWTQQAQLEEAAAGNFGIAVDLSGDTLLVGARGADAGGITATARLPFTTSCIREATSPAGRKSGPAITFSSAGVPQEIVVRAIGQMIFSQAGRIRPWSSSTATAP